MGSDAVFRVTLAPHSDLWYHIPRLCGLLFFLRSIFMKNDLAKTGLSGVDLKIRSPFSREHYRYGVCDTNS
jgi:hypothetical protein